MKKHIEGTTHNWCDDTGVVYNTNRALKVREDRYGYLRLNLIIDGNHKTVHVHTLVAELFIPNVENKFQINHKDGNKQNNSVDNLEWCTAKENVIHARETGLHQGVRSSAIITKGDVVLHFDTITAMCSFFHVNHSTVYRRLHGGSFCEFRGWKLKVNRVKKRLMTCE